MGQAGAVRIDDVPAPEEPAPVAKAEACPLTSYQCVILQWVSNGKSDAVVAAIMGTTEGMIHQHMHRIFNVIGVPSRTSAVAMALRKGWIT